MIKWKVNDYFHINFIITHTFNLFMCSFAVIKLIYHLNIPPAYICTFIFYLQLFPIQIMLIYLKNSMYNNTWHKYYIMTLINRDFICLSICLIVSKGKQRKVVRKWQMHQNMTLWEKELRITSAVIFKIYVKRLPSCAESMWWWTSISNASKQYTSCRRASRKQSTAKFLLSMAS